VNDFQEGKVFPRPSPNAGPRDHEAAPGRAGQCTTSAVVRGGEVASAPRAERGRPRALQAQVVAGARTKRRGGAVGRRQKMTLREKEKLYIDCCASYNVEKARAPAGAARRGAARRAALTGAARGGRAGVADHGRGVRGPQNRLGVRGLAGPAPLRRAPAPLGRAVQPRSSRERWALEPFRIVLAPERLSSRGQSGASGDSGSRVCAATRLQCCRQGAR
jgi:hypothetical protein